MEVTQRRSAGGGFGRWAATRRGTFTIAAIATVVAAVILLYALHQYRKSIETTGKPASVLVANRFIEKGTSGAAIGVGQYFTVKKVSRNHLSSEALTSSAALQGKVASTDIYPGQQLTASAFAGGGLFYSKLPPSKRAISVPVDSSHGLVGDVQTGGRVDVYVSFKKESLTRPAYVRLVAQDVVVLDATHESGTGGLVGGSKATQVTNAVLEVSPHQAGELAFASDYGKVWLVLRPAHGSASTSELINEASILSENQSPAQQGAK